MQAKAILQAEDILINQPNSQILIVSGQGWHEGVIGIVAGRLKDKFHRPVIVISFDEDGNGKGSARGIAGFSLGDAIMAAHQAGHLLGGGGHAMAAGLSLRQEQLASFQEFMNNAFDKQLGTLPLFRQWLAFLRLFPACHKQLVDWLDKCAPFGSSLPRTFIVG